MDPHANNKNVISENGNLLMVFVLLTLVAWILRGSCKTDGTGTHVLRWLRVVPQVVLAGWKPECGSHIDASEFSSPYVEFAPFRIYIQNPDKALHHRQNTPPTSHYGQLLKSLALAFAFCNFLHDWSTKEMWMILLFGRYMGNPHNKRLHLLN